MTNYKEDPSQAYKDLISSSEAIVASVTFEDFAKTMTPTIKITKEIYNHFVDSLRAPLTADIEQMWTANDVTAKLLHMGALEKSPASWRPLAPNDYIRAGQGAALLKTRAKLEAKLKRRKIANEKLMEQVECSREQMQRQMDEMRERIKDMQELVEEIDSRDTEAA